MACYLLGTRREMQLTRCLNREAQKLGRPGRDLKIRGTIQETIQAFAKKARPGAERVLSRSMTIVV